MARLRIVTADFYMNAPISGLDCMYSEFRGTAVHLLPVIRIFGTLSTGEKTCLHVHGAFPYIYIPYDGNADPNCVTYQVASSLDKAINLSLGQASSNVQHVYKVLLVSGIPFYGYHAKEHQFLKIYFYNPLIVKKACTLLENGNILGKIFQPHEAHIPYILQFMIDYNLHGMSFINLSEIKYRTDPTRDLHVPPDLLLPPTVQRQSVCKIEADAQADHILNRLDVARGKLAVNPGISALWDDERQRRRNKGEDSQILPCLTQSRTDVEPTATHRAFRNVLLDKLSGAAKKRESNREANLSVYPAETPPTPGLLDASTIESHAPSSQSSDSTFLDETITPEDATLDETVENLVKLLTDLRDDVEKDSILSQAPKDQESEDEYDLSVPLNAVQTPKKLETERLVADDVSAAKEEGEPVDEGTDSDFNDSYFDTTIHIPQLDGVCDYKRARRIKKVSRFKKLAERKMTGVLNDVGCNQGNNTSTRMLDQLNRKYCLRSTSLGVKGVEKNKSQTRGKLQGVISDNRGITDCVKRDFNGKTGFIRSQNGSNSNTSVSECCTASPSRKGTKKAKNKREKTTCDVVHVRNDLGGPNSDELGSAFGSMHRRSVRSTPVKTVSDQMPSEGTRCSYWLRSGNCNSPEAAASDRLESQERTTGGLQLDSGSNCDLKTRLTLGGGANSDSLARQVLNCDLKARSTLENGSNTNSLARQNKLNSNARFCAGSSSFPVGSKHTRSMRKTFPPPGPNSYYMFMSGTDSTWLVESCPANVSTRLEEPISKETPQNNLHPARTVYDSKTGERAETNNRLYTGTCYCNCRSKTAETVSRENLDQKNLRLSDRMSSNAADQTGLHTNLVKTSATETDDLLRNSPGKVGIIIVRNEALNCLDPRKRSKWVYSAKLLDQKCLQTNPLNFNLSATSKERDKTQKCSYLSESNRLVGSSEILNDIKLKNNWRNNNLNTQTKTDTQPLAINPNLNAPKLVQRKSHKSERKKCSRSVKRDACKQNLQVLKPITTVINHLGCLSCKKLNCSSCSPPLDLIKEPACLNELDFKSFTGALRKKRDMLVGGTCDSTTTQHETNCRKLCDMHNEDHSTSYFKPKLGHDTNSKPTDMVDHVANVSGNSIRKGREAYDSIEVPVNSEKDSKKRDGSSIAATKGTDSKARKKSLRGKRPKATFCDVGATLVASGQNGPYQSIAQADPCQLQSDHAKRPNQCDEMTEIVKQKAHSIKTKNTRTQMSVNETLKASRISKLLVSGTTEFSSKGIGISIGVNAASRKFSKQKSCEPNSVVDVVNENIENRSKRNIQQSTINNPVEVDRAGNEVNVLKSCAGLPLKSEDSHKKLPLQHIKPLKYVEQSGVTYRNMPAIDVSEGSKISILNEQLDKYIKESKSAAGRTKSSERKSLRTQSCAKKPRNLIASPPIRLKTVSKFRLEPGKVKFRVVSASRPYTYRGSVPTRKAAPVKLGSNLFEMYPNTSWSLCEISSKKGRNKVPKQPKTNVLVLSDCALRDEDRLDPTRFPVTGKDVTAIQRRPMDCYRIELPELVIKEDDLAEWNCAESDAAVMVREQPEAEEHVEAGPGEGNVELVSNEMANVGTVNFDFNMNEYVPATRLRHFDTPAVRLACSRALLAILNSPVPDVDLVASIAESQMPYGTAGAGVPTPAAVVDLTSSDNETVDFFNLSSPDVELEEDMSVQLTDDTTADVDSLDEMYFSSLTTSDLNFDCDVIDLTMIDEEPVADQPADSEYMRTLNEFRISDSALSMNSDGPVMDAGETSAALDTDLHQTQRIEINFENEARTSTPVIEDETPCHLASCGPLDEDQTAGESDNPQFNLKAGRNIARAISLKEEMHAYETELNEKLTASTKTLEDAFAELFNNLISPLVNKKCVSSSLILQQAQMRERLANNLVLVRNNVRKTNGKKAISFKNMVRVRYFSDSSDDDNCEVTLNGSTRMESSDEDDDPKDLVEAEFYPSDKDAEDGPNPNEDESNESKGTDESLSLEYSEYDNETLAQTLGVAADDVGSQLSKYNKSQEQTTDAMADEPDSRRTNYSDVDADSKCKKQITVAAADTTSQRSKYDEDMPRQTTGMEAGARAPKRPKLESVAEYVVNQYRYLDGTNDSSSSDDEEQRRIVKRHRTRGSRGCSSQPSKYSPLAVTFSSPGKSSRKDNQSSQGHIIEQSLITLSNKESRTASQLKAKITRHVHHQRRSNNSQIKFKRKLTFSEVGVLSPNETTIEEKLLCQYKGKRTNGNKEAISKTLPDLLAAENDSEREGEPTDAPEPSEPHVLNEDVPAGSKDVTSCISQSVESYNLSDDMFSPDLPVASSGEAMSPPAQNVELKTSVVEEYDLGKNFIPLAGPSTASFEQAPDERVPGTLCIYPIIDIQDRIERAIDSQGSSGTIIVNSSSTSDQITPYQKGELTGGLLRDLSTYELSGATPSCTTDGLMAVAPKYNPPSSELVRKTLEEFNIPEVRYQKPYYGDCVDVTGNVEVGLNVLKIPSKTVKDLPEFTTHTLGIEHYRKIAIEALAQENLTSKEIANYKLAFCRDRDCIVVPVKRPPTRKEVELWLETKSAEGGVSTVKKEKARVRIPQSPGAADDSGDSLSLSPCTPTDLKVSPAAPTPDDVSGITSPVIKKNDVLRRQRKRLVERNSSSLERQACSDTANDTVQHNEQHYDVIRGKPGDKNHRHSNSCQITGVSFDNTHNFAMSLDNLQQVKAVQEHQYLTVMAMEVHVHTRGDLKPNPQLDSIRAIFYSIYNDVPDDHDVSVLLTGAFVVDSQPQSPGKAKVSIVDGIGVNCHIKCVDSETNMLQEFVTFIKQCDPEILMGYEIEMLSWGYLVERGYVLGLNLASLLSRIPNDNMRLKTEGETDTELKLTGRIVIDFWRLMKHELALQSYTFENIVYHILHQRVPLYSFKDLSFWWNHPTAVLRHRTINYYKFRVKAVQDIMDKLDLIGQTSELARLFGIQFYEVLSRGSQFRVESMMLRLAKPLNYIAVSPSVQQRAKMRAPEFLPLIMEPESKFYTDPVIVLDFQSLYPSMIIGYNYCFSTCVGRVEHLGQNLPFEFGCTQLKVSRSRLGKLLRTDLLTFSPCGIAFVKPQVRQGILPRMLQEILDTRLMVKKSMKENAGDKTLQKVLHARQLGLKLIANVTYGYTSANFSGRMPAVEIADSVVSKGRETLQRAITLVENTSRWGARVVYGDTDSLFVLVSGKSREEAFRIGSEIADAVTKDNPSPVKLKLEKVFHPCILQTKKRYVGYMYESADQKEAEFCAKGIETVRRDGCPAVSKMLEKCLKMLFDTPDVSLIRKYVLRQFSKLLTGRVSVQDLTFAKEYRGASGYRPGACVPALELARKWTAVDKRNEPRGGERVPYVIVNGPPGLPLIRLVRSPRELLADASLRPNALYYITKVIIPPINRCFLLIGADLNTWFNDMPRRQIKYLPTSSPSKGKKSTISQYFTTTSCAICGQQSRDGFCDSCVGKPQESAVLLHEKVRIWEKNHYETSMICQSCCGRYEDLVCMSLDCPVLYRRTQTEKDLQQSSFVRHLISTLPKLDF